MPLALQIAIDALIASQRKWAPATGAFSMPTRQLPSDHLGQKGEARFTEYCNDAQLVCNKVSYDRAGWDFVVECPLAAPRADVSLDKRAAPLSCHVQVKTMWSDNDTFSARLSAMERLAKEPKPSFVYVLKIGEDLDPVAAYLVPMMDDALATVLRRLRAITAEGKGSVNRSYVTLSVPPERMIALSGEALRAALIEACGPGPDVVIRKKAEQLKSLGFEADAFRANTTFVVDHENEIADVLLGLKPVHIEDFQGFETRFGITLPIPDANGSGSMHIKPEPADRCQVVVRGATFPFPVSIAAEIILPAVWLEKSKTKYLIRSTLFDIVVMSRNVQLNTRTDNLKSSKLAVPDWIDFFRVMTILSGGAATIDVIPERLARGTITTKDATFADEGESAKLLNAFQSVDSLFRLAGAATRPVLLNDVLPAASRYIALSDLFSGSNSFEPLQFRMNWKGAATPSELDALYIDAIQVADVKLAFSCIATMVRQSDERDEDGAFQWKSRALKAREITSVRNFSDDYEKFAERSKAETGLDAVLMATYDEEGPKPG
jgi:hypothetical protein